MTTETIQTAADREVEEIVEEVRRALYRRALKYARRDRGQLHVDDIIDAAKRLFLENRWPQNLIDRVID